MKLLFLFFLIILNIASCFSFDLEVQNLEFHNPDSPRVSFSGASVVMDNFQLQVGETSYMTSWRDNNLVLEGESERIVTPITRQLVTNFPFSYFILNTFGFSKDYGVSMTSDLLEVPIATGKVVSLQGLGFQAGIDLIEARLNVNYIRANLRDLLGDNGLNIETDGLRDVVFNKSGNTFSFSALVDAKVDFDWFVKGRIEDGIGHIAIHIDEAQMADISAKNYTMIVLMGLFPNHQVQGDSIYINL